MTSKPERFRTVRAPATNADRSPAFTQSGTQTASTRCSQKRRFRLFGRFGRSDRIAYRPAESRCTFDVFGGVHLHLTSVGFQSFANAFFGGERPQNFGCVELGLRGVPASIASATFNVLQALAKFDAVPEPCRTAAKNSRYSSTIPIDKRSPPSSSS